MVILDRHRNGAGGCSHKDVVILDRHRNGAGGYGIWDRIPDQVISARCLSGEQHLPDFWQKRLNHWHRRAIFHVEVSEITAIFENGEQMEPLLQIREVTRKFGDVCVLNRLSLTVQRGEIFGLLGLNGAGKTTLFKCILQLISLGAGSILYGDKPLDQATIHEKIGYLPEFYLPPGELRAGEYLRLLGLAVSGARPDVDFLLQKTGLDANKLISDYSRGMIQRLGLAIALLKSPEFIILDEPTLGLDPLVRLKLLEWLKELNAQGKTILLSSHDFAQVAKVCQRVAVLHKQELRFIGPLSEFLDQHATSSLEEAFLKEIGGLNA